LLVHAPPQRPHVGGVGQLHLGLGGGQRGVTVILTIVVVVIIVTVIVVISASTADDAATAIRFHQGPPGQAAVVLGEPPVQSPSSGACPLERIKIIAWHFRLPPAINQHFNQNHNSPPLA